MCVLAPSQSPANNVSMVARSPRRVWREMCNLTRLSATQSWTYSTGMLAYVVAQKDFKITEALRDQKNEFGDQKSDLNCFHPCASDLKVLENAILQPRE